MAPRDVGSWLAFAFPTLMSFLPLLVTAGTAQPGCGSRAGGAMCAMDLCCSWSGYCGTTHDYCGRGNCQSGACTAGGASSPSLAGGGSGVSLIITALLFHQFLSNAGDGGCPANGFYTYDAFLGAAAAFEGFGTTGNSTMQRRELAAFFAHVAYETTDGCYKEDLEKQTFCDATPQWPCAVAQQYYGRGPLLITWNFNYGPAGEAIGFDGINNPDRVATDAVTSFETGIWIWMTRNSPSSHAIITSGQGFGPTTTALFGSIACGAAQQQDRIHLYQSFCSALGVDPGANLSC